MGGVINIITKKNPDKPTGSAQIETRIAEDSSTFGNTYGANAYFATPLVKNKLSMNLRAGYRLGDQNAFRKPEGLSGCTIRQNNQNAPVDCYANPYSTHSATGYTQWNAGTRFNYTPNSKNNIYLDAEVFFTRAGSLNTSSSQITAIRDFYKTNTVLNHDGNYSCGNHAKSEAHIWHLA